MRWRGKEEWEEVRKGEEGKEEKGRGGELINSNFSFDN